jgi:hypothetical protein
MGILNYILRCFCFIWLMETRRIPSQKIVLLPRLRLGMSFRGSGELLSGRGLISRKILKGKWSGVHVLFNRAQINAFVLISLPPQHTVGVAIWTA